jgi:hypothetical protein
MRLRLILLYTALVLSIQIVSAQYYDTGQDPASLKWKQIKTGRFTVIYPEKYGQEGITYAKSLEDGYSRLTSLFPETKFRIPVVIHNYTIQSNGYVAWAPRRIELYPTPEQNTIPLAAETQLAVHELTHVLQMESLDQGFSKGMSLLLGEQFIGVVSTFLPSWLLEGDAVFAESALTESGRGRTPSFQKQLKAMTTENGKFYNYDKLLNGSYKDFVPDQYQYGFQMVTWALAKNDPHIWNNVFSFTGRKPYTLNPVNVSLSKSSGLSKEKLFKETFDSLRTIWTKELLTNNTLLYETINPDKKGNYINYYSPVYAGKDSIIAIKTSLSSPPSFVLINPTKKTEKRIHIPGQVYPWVISYAKSKIVWVETQSDPRWANREYSVIKLMDINARTITKLSRKSRYLAASVSPDGTKIATVENTINNINSLVLINSETGALIQSVPTPWNVYLQRPQWEEGGKKITFIFLSDAGEGILSYKVASQEWETLVEAARDDLQSSFLRNDSLFFISSCSGIDNIYLRTPDRKTIALTRSRYGAVDLCIQGNKLFFGDYTSLGNNISSTIITGSSGPVIHNADSSSFLIHRFDIKPQSTADTNGTIYKPEPYRKWQHIFKFHSWMPFYADINEIKVDPAAIRPGVTIMSQNILSTLISTIGYEYSAEKQNVFHSTVTWRGVYPVLESQLAYGNKPLIYNTGSDGNSVAYPPEIKPGLSFINTVSLPLNFSSGRFSEYLQPSISSDYRSDYIYINEAGTYNHGQTIISGRLYLSNYCNSAIRDIYPRWAQIIDMNYTFAPFDKEIYGSSKSIKTAFYFPGVLPNNGIKIRLEKEKQDPALFLYGNNVSLPRGYNNIISKDIDFLSVDYFFPLAYPDFNVSSLVYLNRIRTSLFYDYASGPGNSFYQESANGLVPFYNDPGTISFKSFGFELLSDFYILRIPFMISCGIQSAWKEINERPVLKLLFNIDLYGFTIGRKRM